MYLIRELCCSVILRLVYSINLNLKVGRVRRMLRAESTASQLGSESAAEQGRIHGFFSWYPPVIGVSPFNSLSVK